ncbi:protein argonaute 10-like isoform X1 [Nicotiana tabacum]|uniref:Protein argonaute 10-like isoform X1 n=1 Tax=Nicotiana tabacum TaxID=4097 RepID=A0AC58SPU7_TOBAC
MSNHRGDQRRGYEDSSSQDINGHYSRPTGILGERCLVRTNLLKVDIGHRFNHIRFYKVKISPVVSCAGIRQEIMKKLFMEYKHSDLNSAELIYDGHNCVFSVRQLPFSSKDFIVTLVDSDSSFEYGEKETSVVEYFRQRYGLKVSYPMLPAILVGGIESLPMEFCQIVRGQVRKKLNFEQHNYLDSKAHERVREGRIKEACHLTEN